MLGEAHNKIAHDKGNVPEVQSFKSETEKKMREHSNRMNVQMEAMHKRFGEEVQVYMAKAKEHMADYLFKPTAGEKDPKSLMRYKTTI